MKEFSEKLAEALEPLASKFATQRHLAAIRDGFIALMPFVIIASLFILINNVILDKNIGLLKSFGDLSKFKEIGVSVYYGTLGILSLLLSFTVSYKLSQGYGMDPFTTSITSVAALVSVIPTTINFTPEGGTKTFQVGGVFSEIYTSPTGLFVAILVAIISVELLKAFQKNKKLAISMPDSVPPAVAKSFNILIPSLLTLTIMGLASFFSKQLLDMSIYDIITTSIQTPIKAVFQGLPGIMLVMFLQNLLWGFGIHGAFILSPITEPTLLTAIQENTIAFQAGGYIPNIVTKPFIDSFVLLGGGGCTIGLIIALLLFGKRADYKEITKLSIVPGCFNINEPLMFGLPVVFNPVLLIPVVIVPVLNTAIAYFATAVGLVSKTVVLVPWTTPPIVSAFLSTAGDWRAAILAVVLIAISTVIYIPFVLVAQKMSEEV